MPRATHPERRRPQRSKRETACPECGGPMRGGPVCGPCARAPEAMTHLPPPGEFPDLIELMSQDA